MPASSTPRRHLQADPRSATLRRPRHPVGLRRILDALDIHPRPASLSAVNRSAGMAHWPVLGAPSQPPPSTTRQRRAPPPPTRPASSSSTHRHTRESRFRCRRFGRAAARTGRYGHAGATTVPRPPHPVRVWSRRTTHVGRRGRVGGGPSQRRLGGGAREDRDREERGDVAAAHRHPARASTDLGLPLRALRAVGRRVRGSRAGTGGVRRLPHVGCPVPGSSAASRPVCRLPNGLRRAAHGRRDRTSGSSRASCRGPTCTPPTSAGASIDCDLTGADVSQATLDGVKLHGSDLADIVGSALLRDVEIDSTQVVAVALAVFDSIGIRRHQTMTVAVTTRISPARVGSAAAPRHGRRAQTGSTRTSAARPGRAEAVRRHGSRRSRPPGASCHGR